MAQVVQRRGTPAYLVVVFVILSVITAGLAVLFYVRWDEQARGRAEDRKLLAEKKEELAEMRKAQKLLIEAVTVEPGKPEAAIQQADAVRALPYAQDYKNMALCSVIEALSKLAAGKDQQIQDLKQQSAQRLDKLQDKDAALSRINTEFEKKARQLQQDREAADATIQRELQAKDEQLRRAMADKQAIIEQREQEKAILARKRDDLVLEVQDLQTRLAIAHEAVRKLKGEADVSVATLLQHDGKVLRALPDQRIIFIDLGENNNVKPGLPFAVYDKNKGIPKDGQGKARLVVVNVGPTTAECRIVTAESEDPIVEGDLVANLVFNTHRVHQFIVEGEFDLYGEGRTDPLGNRRVRKMIEDYGGKLGDQVSVNTDFVVMGEEPDSPSRPADDASPAEWRIFTDQRKRYNAYKQIQALATNLRIPVLNTTRFLAFSGYVPKKRLTD